MKNDCRESLKRWYYSEQRTGVVSMSQVEEAFEAGWQARGAVGDKAKVIEAMADAIWKRLDQKDEAVKDSSVIASPTHWMPLPAQPAEGK